MEFMIYKDFLKIAKKIGDGGRCEVSIDGVETRDAMLSRQDSKDGSLKNKWFILQDIVDGRYAKDKKCYKHSYIVMEYCDCYAIDYIRPLAKKATLKKEKSEIPTYSHPNKGWNNPRGKNGRFTKKSNTKSPTIEERVTKIERELKNIVEVLGGNV